MLSGLDPVQQRVRIPLEFLEAHSLHAGDCSRANRLLARPLRPATAKRHPLTQKRSACYGLLLRPQLPAQEPRAAGARARAPEPRRRWLAYLVEDAPEGEERQLEILEADAATAALLGAVDGRRSLGEIFAAALPGEDAAVRAAAARSFYEFLRRLGAFGFSARSPGAGRGAP